eukprot:scaffold40838_cov26-Tisochrysis_lutea.AAC.1
MARLRNLPCAFVGDPECVVRLRCCRPFSHRSVESQRHRCPCMCQHSRSRAHAARLGAALSTLQVLGGLNTGGGGPGEAPDEASATVPRDPWRLWPGWTWVACWVLRSQGRQEADVAGGEDAKGQSFDVASMQNAEAQANSGLDGCG